MADVELPPEKARLTCSALRARVLHSMGFVNAMVMVPDCSPATSASSSVIRGNTLQLTQPHNLEEANFPTFRHGSEHSRQSNP
jgi:hypothetical protein